ncbi:MAG: geopeptide radical SAM maturase [Deltaproteobacteria bacterium]|nr:geopeptide radical SAM maturase [Deltaproteobacteria bacterium]
MLLSRYLKVFTTAENKEHLLVFSTRSCSKTLIRKEKWDEIERRTLSSENKAALEKAGILVNDREEEKRTVCDTFKELNRRSTSVDIIVVLNLDCNFACKYCYEGAMKGNIYMNEGTAAALIDFIRKRLDHDKRALHLDFYGGEPLLSPDLIRYISTQLNRLTKEDNISCTFGLVTNGSLFNRRTAEELVGMGLKTVKITLDGPANIHNKNRPFRSGAGSFDIILKNIKETCNLVKIAIGGNFEKENYRDFPLLLDRFLDEGLTPEKIAQIKFDTVIKRPERFLLPTDFNEGCMSLDEEWVMEASLFLREEILKRGFYTPGIKPAFCSVESLNSYVANYDGVLYKCPGFLGIEGFEAGDLENGPKNCSLSYGTEIWNNDECLECEYLPLCFGGCRFVKYVRDGKVNLPDCRRKYFDTCLETLVKQDIKYGIKAER